MPRERDLERILASEWWDELDWSGLSLEELELEFELELELEPASLSNFIAFSLFLMSLLICHISLSKLSSGFSSLWDWDSLRSGRPSRMMAIVRMSSLESEEELEVEELGVLDPSLSLT